MPRRPGTDTYVVRVEGAGRAAASFSRAQRALQDQIIEELRALQRELPVIFRSYAPEDTGQTRDNIDAIPYFVAREPRLSVRIMPLASHGDGGTYDYLDVPRFGHREGLIFPRGRALKVHYAGHRNPHAFVFRAWVTGVGHPHPDVIRQAARSRADMRQFRQAFRPVDWVEDAVREAEQAMHASAARLGRRIERQVISTR